MPTSLNFPKPLIGVLLAGIAYFGIRSLSATHQSGGDGSSFLPGAPDTEPVPAINTRSTIRTKNNVVSRTSSTPLPASRSFPLKAGSKGKLVADLQKALGIKADGIFGKQTAAALNARYHVTTVSEQQYLSMVPNSGNLVATQTGQPQRGQIVVCIETYLLPIGLKVPAGFPLGYATGRFNTETDLVTVRSIEITCAIDATNSHCPEYLKRYHRQRFTYWTTGHSYRLFTSIQAAMNTYPQLYITTGFIKP